MSAKFLLRFDDICPTMKWSVWNEVVEILNNYKIKPIIAVVPENLDEALFCEAEAADYWEKLRLWQAQGWTIALHGFHHVYENRNSGIIKVNDYSEFAGVSKSEQQLRISRGLAILNSHGIHCSTWVAPAHSFDNNTVNILREQGIKVISDGYSNSLFCQSRMLWVPCQLYKFMPKKTGVWTVCKHPNMWSNEELESFREEIETWHDKIVSMDSVVSEFGQPGLFHSLSQSFLSSWRCHKNYVVRKTKDILRGGLLSGITNFIRVNRGKGKTMDFKELYQSDISRYAKIRFGDYIQRFHLYFRKCQTCRNPLLKGLYIIMFLRLKSRHGIEISHATNIGKGLYLGHPFNITINQKAIIGSNCNIHKGVSIGQENRGARKGTPIIGNKVWIGINATIVGNITIGDDVLIAPNTYVNCDIPSHSVVFGNPCVVKHRDDATEGYINNVL